MKNRIERINQLMQAKIAEIILREVFVKDALITVQGVNTAKDLKFAKIRVSIMPFSRSVELMKLLEKQTPNIQIKLNSEMKIKFVPKIKFYLDKSEEQAGKIETILRNLKK